jgi:AcrR family transcriptional regulator
MPKIVDHIEYKKELLESCFDFFGKKGYSNATMREIATEIGVSTGSLYHYFPTKEDILDNMFDYIIEKNTLEHILIINEDDSVEERVNTLMDFWMQNQEFYQNVMLLAIDLNRKKTKKIEKLFKGFFDFYTNMLSDKLNISENFSKSIIIQLLGLLFHSILSKEKVSYNDQLNMVKDVLISIFHTNEDRTKNSEKIVKNILFNIISNNIK